jgi:hypothetical protein
MRECDDVFCERREHEANIFARELGTMTNFVEMVASVEHADHSVNNTGEKESAFEGR